MNRSCRWVLPLVVSLALAAVTGCAGLVPILEGEPERRPERRPPSSDPAPPAAGPADPEVRALADLVNRHRRARGLGALAWDPRVADVAAAHSRDMVRRGYFSHKNPDGHTPFDRLLAGGVEYRAAAENIAEGQSSAEQVFESWVSSAGHRRNLENPTHTHHGIGLHQRHWTHILIRPR